MVSSGPNYSAFTGQAVRAAVPGQFSSAGTAVSGQLASRQQAGRTALSIAEPTPTSPSHRAAYTATELFNNQDSYTSSSSSRRLSSSASSSTVTRSASSSIVAAALNKSTSSSVVTETRNMRETRRTSIKDSAAVLEKHKTALANAHVNGTLRQEEEPAVMLPCEFCESMIPMTKLLSHQAECVNPSNVRGSGSRYRAGSVTRTSSLTTRASSVTRTALSEVRRGSGGTGTDSGSSSRKISPTSPPATSSSSIVSKYASSPAKETPATKAVTTSYLPDSPPSYERDYSSSSHYTGRSSYLREVAQREQRTTTTTARSSLAQQATKTKTKETAPGLYTNDDDREGLRQMLSSLRR